MATTTSLNEGKECFCPECTEHWEMLSSISKTSDQLCGVIQQECRSLRDSAYKSIGLCESKVKLPEKENLGNNCPGSPDFQESFQLLRRAIVSLQEYHDKWISVVGTGIVTEQDAEKNQVLCHTDCSKPNVHSSIH